MGTKNRLETLVERKAKIDQQIASLKARQVSQDRKDMNHLKILIGAAILTDVKIHPETDTFIKEILKRAIKEKRDIEFLQSKGWLETSAEGAGQ